MEKSPFPLTTAVDVTLAGRIGVRNTGGPPQSGNAGAANPKHTFHELNPTPASDKAKSVALIRQGDL